jgi:hypothetical protein
VRRSDALRTAGIVLFAVGGLTTGIGAAMFFPGATNGCSTALPGEGDVAPAPAAVSLERVRSNHQALLDCKTTTIAGIGVLTAGLVTAVVAIPLFVIGSKQVPATTTTGQLVPELLVGAANAALRWAF